MSVGRHLEIILIKSISRKKTEEMLLSTMMNNRTTLPLELEVDIFPLNRSGSDPDSGETGGREGGHFHLLSVAKLQIRDRDGFASCCPSPQFLLSSVRVLSQQPGSGFGLATHSIMVFDRAVDSHRDLENPARLPKVCHVKVPFREK